MVLTPAAKRISRCPAFTLVELLACVAVGAVFFALIFSAASRSIKSAREAKSFSNLRQLVVLVNAYVMDNDGTYPPDTSPAYCNRLYPYLKPGEPVVPAEESNAKLAGTVFVSPGMTKAILAKYNYDNSFSGQYVIRQVYGFNGNLDEDIQSRPVRLQKPSATCLLMSALGPRADFASNAEGIDIGAEAYDGWLHTAFADGHVEKIKKEAVPHDATAGPNHLFWKGVE